MEYLDPQRVLMTFEMPLAELIVDYYDQLKSRSQGYASMDYEAPATGRPTSSSSTSSSPANRSTR